MEKCLHNVVFVSSVTNVTTGTSAVQYLLDICCPDFVLVFFGLFQYLLST
jgi:hypothetical protein